MTDNLNKTENILPKNRDEVETKLNDMGYFYTYNCIIPDPGRGEMETCYVYTDKKNVKGNIQADECYIISNNYETVTHCNTPKGDKPVGFSFGGFLEL